MKGMVEVYNKTFEYDFLAGWIRYNRMEEGISLEALSYGICSPSHLSCFENGKKTLRGEVIEALLKKLKITSIIEIDNIGLLREKFHSLMFLVEGYDNQRGEEVYIELMAMEDFIRLSPYNIEFSIYKLMYNVLVERKTLSELQAVITALDKIYITLNEDLQYLYMLITGKLIYDFKDHSEGISRLLISCKIKDTPWINYRLGVEYGLNEERLKGIQHLQKALDIYQATGRYRNAINCYIFLGKFHMSLKDYEKAEQYFNSVLISLDYFNIPKNSLGIYNNLANLYYHKGEYEESIKFCRLAMEDCSEVQQNSSRKDRWINTSWHTPELPIIAACRYVEACIKLNKMSDCSEIFSKFLKEENKSSLYYKQLYCLYLSIFHFDEEIFYKEVTENILPYYKKIGYLNIYRDIQLKLIEYLEKKRRYKEANLIYKELLA
jgi:tetratricopeptide (TPR) repeat protein